MTIKELLQMPSPEIYDLKDENNYSGVDDLEKMLNYLKNKDDGFDCDGSIGKNYCGLIREIYRLLWDWKDLTDESQVLRYAYACNGLLMGPETMNSFSTTYRLAENVVGRDKLCLFANAVGRIGNMTLTYAHFNRYIAYDYWDIKIKRQYLDNILLTGQAKNRYINLFFQWDYVGVENNDYILKEFWTGHNEKYIPSHDVIDSYIDQVDLYTKRRGLFMTGMLRVANANKSDYDTIRDNVFLSDRAFYGYQEVLGNISKLKLSKETEAVIADMSEKMGNHDDCSCSKNC